MWPHAQRTRRCARPRCRYTRNVRGRSSGRLGESSEPPTPLVPARARPSARLRDPRALSGRLLLGGSFGAARMSDRTGKPTANLSPGTRARSGLGGGSAAQYRTASRSARRPSAGGAPARRPGDGCCHAMADLQAHRGALTGSKMATSALRPLPTIRTAGSGASLLSPLPSALCESRRIALPSRRQGFGPRRGPGATCGSGHVGCRLKTCQRWTVRRLPRLHRGGRLASSPDW